MLTVFELIMMNYFCGMIERRKTLKLISSRDHCQRFSLPLIYDTSRVGFESAENLGLSIIE